MSLEEIVDMCKELGYSVVRYGDILYISSSFASIFIIMYSKCRYYVAMLDGWKSFVLSREELERLLRALSPLEKKERG